MTTRVGGSYLSIYPSSWVSYPLRGSAKCNLPCDWITHRGGLRITTPWLLTICVQGSGEKSTPERSSASDFGQIYVPMCCGASKFGAKVWS